MSPTRAQLATAKGWTLQGINAWKRPSLPADAQEAGTGQENVAVMESLEHTSNKAPRESSIPIPQNTKRIPKQQGKGSVVSLELLQKCITKWKYVTRKSRSRTDCLVQELQTRQLMKRFLTRWIEEARHVSTLKWRETVRAQVVYRYKTLDRVWRAWKLVKRQRALQADQMSQAAELCMSIS